MSPVLRTYRVRVHPHKAGAHEAFERDEGIPMVRSMPGCLACGFGRVQEAKEPTYLFFSLWRSRADLEAARASPAWKAVVERLGRLGLTVEGTDASEHVELQGLAGIPAAD